MSPSNQDHESARLHLKTLLRRLDFLRARIRFGNQVKAQIEHANDGEAAEEQTLTKLAGKLNWDKREARALEWAIESITGQSVIDWSSWPQEGEAVIDPARPTDHEWANRLQADIDRARAKKSGGVQ